MGKQVRRRCPHCGSDRRAHPPYVLDALVLACVVLQEKISLLCLRQTLCDIDASQVNRPAMFNERRPRSARAASYLTASDDPLK
jgi:hypothetical protein